MEMGSDIVQSPILAETIAAVTDILGPGVAEKVVLVRHAEAAAKAA
jgi:hypothetical protein